MARVSPSDGEEVRRILEGACFNRELLILATTRQRFESHFIHVDAGAIHVAPTMSGEDLLSELRTEELGLRFPSGTRFLEGRTRLLGHGMAEGRRTLRMTIPRDLQDDELRRGHRVTRPGKVEVSFHTKGYQLRAGLLMDISTGGLRVHAPGVDLEAELVLDDRIALTVPLDSRLRFEAKGIVRWVAGRNVGLEFAPALEHSTLSSLARWVFMRREEELQKAMPSVRTPGAPAPVPARDLVLVSSSPEVEEQFRDALADLGPILRVNGALQDLREAMIRNPAIVFIHAKGSSMDDRRRLKALVEVVEGRCPALLVGTDLEPAQLFNLAADLKIQYSFGFRPGVAAFFNRLVRGVIRRVDGTGPGA